SVSHFCYLLYKNLELSNYLEDIEIFALFISCMCHDLDHRGTNNSFQVASKSVLAALYSSEGSVMERHHFAQAIAILNSQGCNIFDHFSRKDYQRMLDLMRDIILATDLAHHLRIFKDLQKMAEGDAGLVAPLVSCPLVPIELCHIPLFPFGCVVPSLGCAVSPVSIGMCCIPIGFCHVPLFPLDCVISPCPHWVVSCILVPIELCVIPVGFCHVPWSPLGCVVSPCVMSSCPYWVVSCPFVPIGLCHVPLSPLGCVASLLGCAMSPCPRWVVPCPLSPLGRVVSPCPRWVVLRPHWVVLRPHCIVPCPLVTIELCGIAMGFCHVPLSPLGCAVSPLGCVMSPCLL
ncbi:uncharacterized protein LOC122190691, partial [Lagopus leucura]|uniref:uncharacterized protein LOC122190691 n=1 Tax=Lagopus leucura TaxID=30410 RepID=UPI001C666D88